MVAGFFVQSGDASCRPRRFIILPGRLNISCLQPAEASARPQARAGSESEDPSSSPELTASSPIPIPVVPSTHSLCIAKSRSEGGCHVVRVLLISSIPPSEPLPALVQVSPVSGCRRDVGDLGPAGRAAPTRLPVKCANYSELTGVQSYLVIPFARLRRDRDEFSVT